MLLGVHVTPRSGKDVVVGVENVGDAPEVRVRVTAAPDGGKANAAVCKLVASSLGIAKGKVTVKRGDTSRHKLLAIDCDEQALSAWLGSLDTLVP